MQIWEVPEAQKTHFYAGLKIFVHYSNWNIIPSKCDSSNDKEEVAAARVIEPPPFIFNFEMFASKKVFV